jgi:hypothetical protein
MSLAMIAMFNGMSKARIEQRGRVQSCRPSHRKFWCEILHRADPWLPAKLLPSARLDQQADEPGTEKVPCNRQELIMTRTLDSRLVSTKTLVRVGVAVLSLNWVGTAFAQGATATVNPPAYGSAWANDHAQSHSLDGRNVALDSSKATRVEAPKKTDGTARLSTRRDGG